MMSFLYEVLNSIGFHHPLHPAFTHLPIGLTIAAFIFYLLSILFKKTVFFQSAKHCIFLAFFSAIPTIIAGYCDWQQFYHGSFLFPIQLKLFLSATLLLLLLAVIFMKTPIEKVISGAHLSVLSLSVIIVAGLGFFGGELVYGSSKEVSTDAEMQVSDESKFVSAGAELFDRKCVFCHFTDNTAVKIGPGLKGLFQKKSMQVSGWPMTEENLLKQLKTPYDEMPSFKKMTDEEIKALTAFLKSI